MYTINNKMFELIKTIDWKDKVLSQSLKELVDSGFIEIEQCIFLKKLYESQKTVNKLDFEDRTGYECFINSIHTDDYTESEFMVQAFLFLDYFFSCFKNQKSEIKLRGIISQTDFGANIKVHRIRDEKKWIEENQIENFDDAMLIME